jgi:hypothetical protein
MASKQKINPRTGKFNLVGSDQEGITDVTSQDGSISVTEPSDGVKDLSVNTASGPLKQEFDTLHEIYNKYKRRPSGNIDTEGIENHWIFPQDKSVQGNVNLPMATGSSQYGDWLLVAICISGTNGSVDTEGRITLKSFSMGSDVDPQLSNTVKFPTLDFRWRLLRGENATDPDSGVPPQLLISDMVYVPTEYKECKGQTVSPSAPTWTFDPSTDFMCVCHKVTQAEYSVSKFTANAGYSYVYYVFLRHKIWHCFYTSLEMTRIVTGSPVQCSYWTNNYHYNAAMQSPATALWNNVMKSPAWTQQGQVSVPLSYWTQYCDRSDNRGAFRDIKCQTLFGETAEHGVTALPTGTRVMAQTSDQKEIFWATYGTTTAAQIQAALDAGKAVMCKYNENIYVLSQKASDRYNLYCLQAQGHHIARMYVTFSNSSWSSTTTTMQTTVERISSTSSTPPSDSNYYSALATKNLIDAVDAKINNCAVDNALATNADLDSIVKPGFYYVGGSNTCTHVASTAGNPFGLVVIHTAAGAYYAQIFFDYWGKTYKRVKGYKGNTEWSAWVELQADWNETDTYSPAYIKNKPSVLNDLETRLSSIESRLAALE